MGQLLMVLKEHEIPARGLVGGKVFEMADKWVCGCKKQSIISVLKARGRIRPVNCPYCGEKAPKTPHGWFKSYRFVPLNDPDFKGEDVRSDEPVDMGVV